MSGISGEGAEASPREPGRHDELSSSIDYEEWDELELSPDEYAALELNRLGDMLAQSVRDDARVAAGRYRAIEEFRLAWEHSRVTGAGLSGMSARAMRAELAARMAVSERTMESLLGYARILVDDLPATYAALGGGRISDRHARIIADESIGLNEEDRAEFERRVLPLAEDSTPQRFRRLARTERERVCARDRDERHRAARDEREVRITPGRDGMAWLTAYLPAPDAVAIDSKLARIARSIAMADTDTDTETETDASDDDARRTHAQIRADVLVDILLDDGALLPRRNSDGTDALRAPAAHRGFRPEVHVTVPVLALLGQDAPEATLDGYGPISHETAAALAGTATGFLRILTHPETGIALSFGRDRYEVPTELKRYLRARDETCRFVGCTRSAALCDIDHTVAWNDGGETDARNLAHLCRGHHRLKHASAWSVTAARDGTGHLTWHSPLGRHYPTKPAITVGAGTVAQESWADDPPPF